MSLLGTRIMHWIRTVSDHYAAGSTVEQLYRLSDTELKQRGLSRDTLAYDVGRAFPTRASAARCKRDR